MSNEILDSSLGNMNASAAQIRIPKDSSILTTGIIALPFSLGIIGIILSIITLVNASKATAMYNEAPGKYLESSFKKVKAGRVCAIVSLSLFFAAILVLIVVVAINA